MLRRTLNGLPNPELQLHYRLEDWNWRSMAWISPSGLVSLSSTASHQSRLELHGSWKRDGVGSIVSILRRCTGERGVNES